MHLTENIERGCVTLHNVNTQHLLRDLEKIYKTTSITKYIFFNISRNQLTFYNFFIPDIYFCVKSIFSYRHRFSETRQLNKILELLETETWYKRSFETYPNKLDFSQLSQLYKTLLPVQVEALHSYNEKTSKLDLNGYLLAADTGTGKSIMSLALTLCLKPDVTFIVCPNSIIDSVWYKALTTEFKEEKTIWKSNSKEPIRKGFDFYIIHYEALSKLLEFINENNRYYDNPVIILDESHNLNDIKALRTKTYLDCCAGSRSKNIIHLSATPTKALGLEFQPLFRAIDKYFTPEVEDAFRSIYGKSISRASEILRNRIDLVSHKIPKSAVMGSDKPIEIQLRIKLPHSEKYTIPFIREEYTKFIEERTKFYKKDFDKYEAIYNKCVNIYEDTIRTEKEREQFKLYLHYVQVMRRGYDRYTMGEYSRYCNEFEKINIIPLLSNELKKEFKNAKSVVKYVDLKITGEFLGGVLGKKRAELHSELIWHSNIDEIVRDATKKTICFSDFVDTILTAKKYFEEKGYNPLLVYGDTNKDVDNILNEFRNNDEINPLLATIKSLSVGHTILVANVAIFLNLPFRSLDKEQAANRIFRIGQDTQVYIYEITLDTGEIGNLSTRMEEIMLWSKASVEAILGKGTDNEINLDSTKFVNNALENYESFSLEHYEAPPMSIPDELKLPFTTYNTDTLYGQYDKSIKIAQLLLQMYTVDPKGGLFTVCQAENRHGKEGKIISLVGDIEKIDQFLHPIYYKGIEFIDSRPYINKEGEVRDYYNQSALIKRAVFDSLWLEDKEVFYSIGKYMIDAFSTWFAFGLQRNLELSIVTNTHYRIVAAIYMLALLLDTKHYNDDEASAHILKQLPQITGLPAQLIKELLDANPTPIFEMFTMERPTLWKLAEVLTKVTNEDLIVTKGMIYNSLCRGAIILSNGQEISSVGLEHPATFVVMLNCAQNTKSTLGLSLLGISKRNDLHGFQKFLEAYGSYKEIR